MINPTDKKKKPEYQNSILSSARPPPHSLSLHLSATCTLTPSPYNWVNKALNFFSLPPPLSATPCCRKARRKVLTSTSSSLVLASSTLEPAGSQEPLPRCCSRASAAPPLTITTTSCSTCLPRVGSRTTTPIPPKTVPSRPSGTTRRPRRGGGLGLIPILISSGASFPATPRY